MRFDGPAIVETKGSTTVVHPGSGVDVDDVRQPPHLDPA